MNPIDKQTLTCVELFVISLSEYSGSLVFRLNATHLGDGCVEAKAPELFEALDVVVRVLLLHRDSVTVGHLLED